MGYYNPIYGMFNEVSIQEQMRQQQLQQFHNNQMLKTFECVHKLEDFLKSADELAPQYRDIATVQCLILLDEYFKRQRMM